MKAKCYGVHRLISAADTCELMQIVEVTDGKVTSHYPFTAETPFTEWLGGTLVLSGCLQIESNLPQPVETICQQLLACPGTYGWHISADDWAFGTVVRLKRLV